MSTAEIRAVSSKEVSPEQLAKLAELETKKQDNTVMATVMSQLSDEYEKLEDYWRQKKEIARVSAEEYDKIRKEVAKESNAKFKQYNMEKMN